jgi:hypothetical protein
MICGTRSLLSATFSVHAANTGKKTEKYAVDGMQMYTR